MKSNTYKFQKLTPQNDLNLAVYEEAFQYIFNNNDIRNIAITGPYSSGKSSVIASFKRKNPELVFMHISLARFSSIDTDKELEIKESVLEGKILNQLIHQIDSDRIPQSNFRVKKKVDKIVTQKITLLISIFIISTIYIILYSKIKSLLPSIPDSWTKNIIELYCHPNILIISCIVVIITFVMMLYLLVSLQRNKNVFKKISFQGTDIEIFENSDDSYFDKYLNEVLYLFENTNASAIVFEDIDRFNANRIFERLREVNTLANIQLEKEKKEYIRFFYLLRDDIFNSKDRTKFFDFLLPVVPVVDTSNSYDQFIAHFENGGILSIFDGRFLQELSLYIDDMRLLKNIYNEFIIYYNRINTTELDCNKMLAVITYKNLFPKDFSDLQLNQGFVFELFNKKEKYIEDEIVKIKEIIEQKVIEIDGIKNEHLSSILELDDAYAMARSRIPSGYQYHDAQVSFENRYNDEYPKRKRDIENKLESNLEVLEKEKINLEHEIVVIRAKALKDIINRENVDRIFNEVNVSNIGKINEFTIIKESEYFSLLIYLISNGYIDETYSDYMTYFYENSLSRVDKAFLRSITDRKAKEYTYKLKNPALVASKLRDVDFKQIEILNFDILEYLLKSNNHSKSIYQFFIQLKTSNQFEFIVFFYELGIETEKFVKTLNNYWPELFASMSLNKIMTENSLKKYSLDTLRYSNYDELKEINKGNVLRNYISNDRNYLQIESDNISKIIEAFKTIGVSFESINYEISNKDLFVNIYEESMYEINMHNIEQMLVIIYDIKDYDSIYHKNYTLLSGLRDSVLYHYMCSKFKVYISVLLKNCNNSIKDSEQYALEIINNSELLDDQVSEYILYLETIITSIRAVKNEKIWGQLLNQNIVAFTAENILDYFERIEHIDAILLQYIERNEFTFDFKDIESEVKSTFFTALVKCNEIPNSKYQTLTTLFNLVFNSFGISGINDDKILILINNKIIKMSTESLSFIRSNYNDVKLPFILFNINLYLDLMNNTLFDYDEMIQILESDIDDKFKLLLIDFCDEPISILEKNYSDDVKSKIMESNLMPNELPILFEKYSELGTKTQFQVFQLSIVNLAIIKDNFPRVSKILIFQLLGNKQNTLKLKSDLIVSLMPKISIESCIEYFEAAELGEYAKALKPRFKPTLLIDVDSTNVLEALKTQRWIESYEEDPDKPGYYKINKSFKRKSIFDKGM